MQSITEAAAAFADLDRAVRTAPASLPDDVFDQLVARWASSAAVTMSTAAADRTDVIVKCEVLGRFLTALDGSVVGDREVEMAAAIVADLKRLRA